MTAHPFPWRVAYWRRCPEWHAKSSPRILDANGVLVCDMRQYVGHPGEYDVVADEAAKEIVRCVNEVNAVMIPGRECGE